MKIEKSISYILFANRNDASDEIVIKSFSRKYIVYTTNERASKISDVERIFFQLFVVT